MKTVVIFVHGMNVRDGGLWTVGRIRPFFPRPYILFNYGHFTLIETRLKNDRVAKRLAETCENAKKQGFHVIAVAHSNGCAIINRASRRYQAPIDKAIYINPALKKDYAPGELVEALDVWYSPSDKAVKFAKWLPFRRSWGEMGATGYIGDDSRIRSFNKEKDFEVSSNKHSDVFKAEKLVYFGPLMAEEALNVESINDNT
jgi:pimeloyl-ACP methyl ester carboxylesterase